MCIRGNPISSASKNVIIIIILRIYDFTAFCGPSSWIKRRISLKRGVDIISSRSSPSFYACACTVVCSRVFCKTHMHMHAHTHACTEVQCTCDSQTHVCTI
uniref:Uncharacterized protein n=1 Tax=Lotharella globosa TaxID=91324 RepID=A0A7S4DS49_9EUKA